MKEIITSLSTEDLKDLIRETLDEKLSQVQKPEPDKTPEDEQLLNPTETVAMLRISKVTLQKWMKADKLPLFTYGQESLFQKERSHQSLKQL